MVNEDHVCEEDGACPLEVSEAPYSEKDGVICISSEAKSEVVEGKALNPCINNSIRFKSTIFVYLCVKGKTPCCGVNDGGCKWPPLLFLDVGHQIYKDYN